MSSARCPDCSVPLLMKMDGSSKRKLSKRKDPELALDFYRAEGYPVASVKEYLMTLLNSNFEEWRLANPTAELAMEQLNSLRGCEVHSSVILSSVDEKVFRRLGVNLTCEPRYES